MSVTAKALINTKYASSSQTTEYTTPPGTRAIIDKFTATNSDSSSQTISIHIVPNGGSASDSNRIVKDKSINAGEFHDFTELKNHILSSGDFISVIASIASKVVIRASGREVT